MLLGESNASRDRSEESLVPVASDLRQRRDSSLRLPAMELYPSELIGGSGVYPERSEWAQNDNPQCYSKSIGSSAAATI
jgi:hypothetical protein